LQAYPPINESIKEELLVRPFFQISKEYIIETEGAIETSSAFAYLMFIVMGLCILTGGLEMIRSVVKYHSVVIMIAD
jgi:hypothetical protein